MSRLKPTYLSKTAALIAVIGGSVLPVFSSSLRINLTEGEYLRLTPVTESEFAYRSYDEAVECVRTTDKSSSFWWIILKNDNEEFGVFQAEHNEVKLSMPQRYNAMLEVDNKTWDGLELVTIVNSRNQYRRYTKDAELYLPPTSYTSTREVLEELTFARKHYSTKNDHRGLFPAVYEVTTKSAIAQIETYKTNGEFLKANFIEQLVIDFGNRYFSALHHYNAGNVDQVPNVWRMAFDHGEYEQLSGGDVHATATMVISLSILAHVVHDLPETLKDIGYSRDVKEHQAAFFEFNQILLDQKNSIQLSILKSYGSMVHKKTRGMLSDVGQFGFNQCFRFARYKASKLALQSSSEQIDRYALGLACTTYRTVNLYNHMH